MHFIRKPLELQRQNRFTQSFFLKKDMKFVIAKGYERYSDFIHSIPSGGYVAETVFCNNRNVVELVTVEGFPMVVKRFKKPNLINQVVYAWFRKDKAWRSHDNALILLEAGIDTPHPIAYIRHVSGGVYQSGWYIYEYFAGDRLDSALKRLDQDGQDKLMTAFFKFTIGLFAKDIINKDYNPGNVLVRPASGGCYHFSLVDINRMSHRPATLADEMAAFNQLNLTAEQESRWLPLYAQLRGTELAPLRHILNNRARRRLRRDRTKAVIHKILRRQ